jgi:hypothetical protein
VRRDLAVEEVATGRWDHLIAAGNGDGWSRAMFIVVEKLDVRLHVLCGSELVYSGTDPVAACRVYNAVPDGPGAVRGLLAMVS